MTYQCVRRCHWNPLRPLRCLGGTVFVGPYYECEVDGHAVLMTPLQYTIKRDMGLCR